MANSVIDAVLTKTATGNTVCVSASTSETGPSGSGTENAAFANKPADGLPAEIARCQEVAEDFFSAVCAMAREDLTKMVTFKADDLSKFGTWTDRIGGDHSGPRYNDLHPITVSRHGVVSYELAINREAPSDKEKDLHDLAMKFFPPHTATGKKVENLEAKYRKLLQDGQNLSGKGTNRFLSNGIAVVPEYVPYRGSWEPAVYFNVMERAYQHSGSNISVKVLSLTMQMDQRYLRVGSEEHEKLNKYIEYRMAGDIRRAEQFFRVD